MSRILLLGAWDDVDLHVIDYEEISDDDLDQAQRVIDAAVAKNAEGHEVPWARTFDTHKLERALRDAYEIEIKGRHGLLYDHIEGDMYGDAG